MGEMGEIEVLIGKEWYEISSKVVNQLIYYD